MLLFPTIICGGTGSRLWPISRELYPKPFIKLDDGQSLLQKAYLHGAHLPGVTEILTVTNKELLFKTLEEYNAINIKLKHSLILEPSGRNTAAAVTAAALYIQQRHGNEAIVLILAADHLISNQVAFQNAVTNAIELAQQEKIVTFGMQANRPETGYGYIEAIGNTVLRFIEKPSLEKAQEYIATNRYFWNSGMFCFTVGTLLQQMEIYSQDILDTMKTCMNKSTRFESHSTTQLLLEPASFMQVPDNSIDYALMEKSNRISVVPCDIGWNDVGSWNTLADLTEADENGNRLFGEVLVKDVHNCYIQSSHHLVGAIGIEQLIVVDTPDALLITNKSRVQDVKEIYNLLKAQNHEAYKLHRTVYRPWGTYTVLEEGEGFKIKRIVINPGANLSLQMHKFRSEHWVVVSGTATVTNGEKILTIQTNQSTYIPAGNKHRLQNLTELPVILIEVQSGDYLGEDDIVRFEDIYGRTTALLQEA